MVHYELYHHGVKGMKWGVIRKRVRSARRKFKKAVDAHNTKKAAKAAEAAKRKPKTVRDMSDEELRSAINRLELEKRFQDLSPKKVSAGKAFVDSVVKNMILPAGEDVGKQLVKSFMTDAVNKSFKLDDELKVFTNNKKK